MPIIVTHFNPDLDAVASIWLAKRFWPGWEKSKLAFVPAGDTYQGQPVDSDSHVLHVDTGLGELDHHQTNDYFCAAQACLEKIKRQKIKIKKFDLEAIERLLEIVCEVDHGRDISWPQADNDRYLFFLEEILGGLNSLHQDDQKAVEFGLAALESIFKIMKDKIRAEEAVDGPRAVKFDTPWGPSVAIDSGNEMILEVGERFGYSLVVKRDPKIGHVRIYARWDRGVDLTPVWQRLKAIDPAATWFLHASKCLLLNGSPRNPKMKPTKLTLDEIIDVLKNA